MTQAENNQRKREILPMPRSTGVMLSLGAPTRPDHFRGAAYAPLASTLTAASALVTLTAGCTGLVESDAPADLTDDVQRSYTMAEQRQR